MSASSWERDDGQWMDRIRRPWGGCRGERTVVRKAGGTKGRLVGKGLGGEDRYKHMPMRLVEVEMAGCESWDGSRAGSHGSKSGTRPQTRGAISAARSHQSTISSRKFRRSSNPCPSDPDFPPSTRNTHRGSCPSTEERGRGVDRSLNHREADADGVGWWAFVNSQQMR